MSNAPVAHIDYETRSACSLKKCGSWRYSIDPTTEILCLVFRLPDWVVGRTELWHPAFPHLGLDERFPYDEIVDLVAWIQAGKPVEAHNSSFERCIWQNVIVPRFGWPPIPLSSWRCSAAKAAAHALPRGLEDVGAALSLVQQKDTEGHKLMLKVSKPRKSRKAERELWERTGTPAPSLLWHESKAYFERLFSYCKQDVLVEAELSAALPDLNPHETLVYTMDQTINQRGFQLDSGAVKTALALIAKETLRLNQELETVTNGTVNKATQRAQMMKWLSENGVHLSDTQKGTIDETLTWGDNDDESFNFLTPKPRRALEIMRALGRSSTAKYESMRNWAGADGRVRGGLLYHGASTGRWSGSGVQPHNFVRGTVKDMDGLWASLKDGSYQGDVMAGLSEGLRGAIVAGPGKTLYVADYAAIEARVVMWLAGEEEALDAFRRNEDIYCVMASDIYGFPVTKHDNPDERQVGKTAILGLGFQMGAPKFVSTVKNMTGLDIDEEMSKQVVDTYRAKFARVKQMWWDQEAAAIKAVKSKRPVTCGYMTWLMDGVFLYCQLPSGRRLAYPFPAIHQKRTPWGEKRPNLTFMGIDGYTRKWKRQSTYGGSIVENQTQSVARDILADALLACEQSKIYVPVLSVHDEAICEVSIGQGSLSDFEALMTRIPKWGNGIPIAVESWQGDRYKK